VTNLGPWHTEDFEALSWHDVHVHGFRFASFNKDNGSAELVLDLDYILKWESSADQCLFTLCRAELTFHDVFGLKLDVDYATPKAGMCPFMIDGIHREALEFPTGFKSFRWHIALSWPEGSLRFEAPAFTQALIGTPVVKAGIQSLTSQERDETA